MFGLASPLLPNTRPELAHGVGMLTDDDVVGHSLA